MEATESELETEVEELRRLVAVIEEGKQGFVASSGRSRFGGKKTEKTERKLGGTAARSLMMKLASGVGKNLPG